MQKFKRLVQWLGLFLFILTFVLTITINLFPLYWLDVKFYDLAQVAQVSEQKIFHNYFVLMKYLNLPWVPHLAMPNFPTSASAAIHFADVKKLFLLNYAVLIISSSSTFFFMRTLKREKHRWQLIRPFQIAMGVPLLLGMLMMVSFEQVFIKFHELLFSNDDWLFNPATDPIITVLPEDFFMHCFILAVVLLEICFFYGIQAGKKDL